MTMSPVLRNLVSDLFVNLSAGWFGAAFITPNFSQAKRANKFLLLTVNITLGIFCLSVAYFFKTL